MLTWWSHHSSELSWILLKQILGHLGRKDKKLWEKSENNPYGHEAAQREHQIWTSCSDKSTYKTMEIPPVFVVSCRQLNSMFSTILRHSRTRLSTRILKHVTSKRAQLGRYFRIKLTSLRVKFRRFLRRCGVNSDNLVAHVLLYSLERKSSLLGRRLVPSALDIIVIWTNDARLLLRYPN